MYGFNYNDVVSFLGKNVKPFWKVFGFNSKNQVFLYPLKSNEIAWSAGYCTVVNVEKTPLFKVTNYKQVYNDLPLFAQ